MFFVDNSGHIFEITEYAKKPIGYEFDETPYVFWLNDNKDNSRLSINNYYAKVINILFPIENVNDFNSINISELLDIDINIDSKIFYLIPSVKFQNALNNSASVFDYICEFDDYDICKQYLNSFINYTDNTEEVKYKKSLIEFGNKYNIISDENDTIENIKENILNNLIFTKQELKSYNDDDLLVIKIIENNNPYILIPIYVIAKTEDEGTWSSNIMIHISYKYIDKEIWCPISVGGTFVDQYESLTIHGQNMGVSLPKDIIKALNGTSYFNDEFNVETYNKKLKEYMLNYMNIKGECGNYNSAITSLKWFDYQDKISLSKLIETDNEFKHQYIRDYFDIHNDIIKVFKDFINTQYVSLNIKLNTESGEKDPQNIDKDSENNSLYSNHFWGEGKPLLKDLIGDDQYTLYNTKEKYSSQQFSYIDTYFKYSFNELLLKISCLAYYYQKYFLPLYIKLKSYSAEYKVYTNDVKLYSYATDHLFENIINLNNYENNVIFNNHINDSIKYLIDMNNQNKRDIIFLTHQYHFVDSKFNEFYINGLGDDGDYENDENNMWYLVNDTCINIPITFKYYEDNPSKNYYNCMIFLKEEEANVPFYQSSFSFLQTKTYKYNSFVIYPKILEALSEKNNNIKQQFVNKNFNLYLYANGIYYEYKFTVKTPEFDVNIGTLKYKYWDNDINFLYNKYHELDYVEEGETKNDSKIYFAFNDIDTEEDINTEEGENNSPVLDITEYIKNYDFFDEPTKYMSSFSQINDIKDDKIIFNTFMHNPEFVNINDLNFGLGLSNNKTLNDLIVKYKDTVNISNNYKYLNMVHLYELFGISETMNDDWIIEHDILKFYKDIMIRVNDIVISKNKLSHKFIIDGQLNNSLETIDGFDNYALSHGNPEIIGGNAWYYILERNINYNLTENNAPSLYSLYHDNTGQNKIGYIIFNSFDNINSVMNKSNIIFNGLRINNTYVDSSHITIKNNKFIFTYEREEHKLNFTNTFVKKTKYGYEKFEPTPYDLRYNYQNIFIKLEFFYYNEIRILNLFGYYTSIQSSNIYCGDFELSEDNNTATCTVYINDPLNKENIQTIYNVKLYKSTYYQYNLSNNEDEDEDKEVFNQNASAIWSTLDENDEIIENNVINELALEYYDGSNDNELNLFDNEEGKINKPGYLNYLVNDLTGIKGKYYLSAKIDSENDSEIVSVKVLVKDSESSEEVIYNSNNENKNERIINLTGDEYQVLLYFSIDQSYSGHCEIIPYLSKYEFTELGIAYGEDNDIMLNLYKDLFYKKYSLILNKGDDSGDEVIKDIWDSKVNLNNRYDTYLMHGYKDANVLKLEESQRKDYPQTWYIVFISKDTCDKFENLALLNKYPETINFESNSKQYVLKHVQSEKLFLINRMKFIPSDGINHFKRDDLIVCSIENNKMLPTNLELHTKWNIKPLSYGMNQNIQIVGNGNMSILSISQKDNLYSKGYYEIEVDYSLNRAFINNKTIKKRLLIEK